MIQSPKDITLAKFVLQDRTIKEIERTCVKESLSFRLERNCLRFTSLKSIHREDLRSKTRDILYTLGLSRSTHYVFVYHPELYGLLSERYLVF